jgi:hypothetical protein
MVAECDDHERALWRPNRPFQLSGTSKLGRVPPAPADRTAPAGCCPGKELFSVPPSVVYNTRR